MVHCARLADEGGRVCTERSTAAATHIADQVAALMMPEEEGREWY